MSWILQILHAALFEAKSMLRNGWQAMGSRAEGARDGFLSRVGSAMTSLAGITTAIATITTSVSAVLGVVVHHQANQLQHANAIVSHQAQQIQQLRASGTPTASPTPSAAALNGASPLSAAHYLGDLTPTVDNGQVSAGQVVINARPYAKSITFGCDGGNGAQPDEAYDVAGSNTFTAVVGIPDNMSNVTGVIATVTFSNEADQQIGKPVQVSLGHPVKVTLHIGNVTQLGMTCVGRDARTGQNASYGFQVAMGNAGLS